MAILNLTRTEGREWYQVTHHPNSKSVTATHQLTMRVTEVLAFAKLGVIINDATERAVLHPETDQTYTEFLKTNGNLLIQRMTEVATSVPEQPSGLSRVTPEALLELAKRFHVSQLEWQPAGS
jgi:hypothetical protein